MKRPRRLRVTLLIRIERQIARGEVERLTVVGIAVSAVPGEIRDVFAFRVSVAAGSAAEVPQDCLRGINGALTSRGRAQTVINIVVSHGELGFVEALELAIERGPREKAGAGDGGDVARGVRQKKKT